MVRLTSTGLPVFWLVQLYGMMYKQGRLFARQSWLVGLTILFWFR